ncbi:MAG: invasion associated locus B family protein [Rhodomicrobiaceae bacterium]
MRLASACLAAGLICAVSPALAQTAKLLKTFDDWQVFVHEANNEKVCFAASAPKEMSPKGANRGSVFLYLTTWQKDGVRNELSVKVGYTLKPDSTPTVSVGSQDFQLYPKDDKAFMRDPADERKLVDAMRKGSNLTIKGTSNRGTSTEDKYSLSGLKAALEQVGQACP